MPVRLPLELEKLWFSFSYKMLLPQSQRPNDVLTQAPFKTLKLILSAYENISCQGHRSGIYADLLSRGELNAAQKKNEELKTRVADMEAAGVNFSCDLMQGFIPDVENLFSLIDTEYSTRERHQERSQQQLFPIDLQKLWSEVKGM